MPWRRHNIERLPADTTRKTSSSAKSQRAAGPSTCGAEPALPALDERSARSEIEKGRTPWTVATLSWLFPFLL